MEEIKYVGVYKRMLAVLIDIIIWNLDLLIVAFLIFGTGLIFNTAGFINGILAFLIYSLIVHGIAYKFIDAWLISTLGGSLGKYICGFRIYSENETTLTFWDAFFRENIAKIASNLLFGAGYYWINKTPKKQGWHDSIVGTTVQQVENRILLGVMVVIVGGILNLGGLFWVTKTIISNNDLINDIETIGNSTIPNPIE